MSLSYILAFSAIVSEGGEAKGGLLDVNPGLAFWSVLTFLLLLIVLRKFAWKPILEALDKREKEIQTSLDAAKKAGEDAALMNLENLKVLARAEEEGQRIISASREHADKLKVQLEENARKQAEKLLEDAKAEIDRKKQEALSEIKNEIADLSIQIAEKLIRKNLDKEGNKYIINQSIEEIRKN